MTYVPLNRATADSVKEVSRLLGIPCREGRDAFGRPYLDIEMGGLQHMHEVAVSMGHVEVAAHIRQMLSRCKQVDS